MNLYLQDNGVTKDQKAEKRKRIFFQNELSDLDYPKWIIIFAEIYEVWERFLIRL